ncbi:cell surface protein [Pseudoalteromonas luteoviolacea S2607]|uniref:alkaline phosphatase PhoX n=1 Tax=Pseudoalteromonas luteoviolacea TaxID=43657 RepID=UPI0007B04685|nr:alkaline phosphatase PhoX [Pseudoalteromonas luteoviolacea]KZN34045.1 cell surface protein [Pseudoalteromonas luteoviolacea S2607]
MKRIAYSLIASAVVLALTACDGDDGAQGVKGEQGVQGETGQAGSNGTNGKDGTNGTNGSNGTDGQNGVDGQNGADGTDGINGGSGLVRIATVPTGSEVTGLFLTEQGDLFFNAQHPSDENSAVDSFNNRPFNTGTVGVLTGVNFNELPRNLVDAPLHETEFEQQTIVTAIGQYQILGQSGDTYADLGEDGLAGGLGVIYGMTSGQEIIKNDMPDFNGFIFESENTGYLFTNWEDYPGGMSRLKMSKSTTGRWSVEQAMMIDFDAVKGTAANCFGSVSPWGTPLTSEEWIVNSTVDTTTSPDWNAPVVSTRLQQFRDFLAPESPNPYRYGYIAEVKSPLSDTPTVEKHYTIGRYEHENAVVMPDRRTVYSSQDDTGGVLFKFVADNAEDLSSGTLYGAKLTQDKGLSDPAVTGFDVEWVEIATGTNAAILEWITEYDGIAPDSYVDGQTNYISMADVQAWVDGKATYPTAEEGGSPVTAGKPMDDRVAFLEARQAARLKGATAEWRKLEGLAINHDRVLEAISGQDVIEGEVVEKAYLYIGIADIDNTMIDGEGDIQLSSRVKDCGGVYRAHIDQNYSLTRIEPVVMGSTYRSSLTSDVRCDASQLAQPDNVIVMRDGRILIGEDHSASWKYNNTLWMYDPKSK